MARQKDLLVEVGTEELPPKSLVKLSRAFAAGIVSGLQEQGFTTESVENYATPRRLAVLITGLPMTQEDQLIERRGPALTAAFDDDGVATKAAQGFAKSCGVEVEDLEKLETDKGAWLAFRSEQKGEKTETLLPDIVSSALLSLPIPRRMRWGAGDVEFVRPVHWIVLLFGKKVVSASILGITTSAETRGHRFHHPQKIKIPGPLDYLAVLNQKGHVIPELDERRDRIRQQIETLATELGGAAIMPASLLDEVTGLVEWPKAIAGEFDQRFLELPPEVLISAMQDHQKYFPIADAKGKLMPHFVTISNINSADMSHVRQGNERVIRPRFSDAAFFWEQDRNQPLIDRSEALKTVVFQHKLGSLFDKSQRVASIAAFIAERMEIDVEQAQRAAQLCKCDLLTHMVGEFPALQGTMGRYYAGHDGEAAEVAAALEEHYMPRQAGDPLPAGATGRALALADRLDTLIGIFAIGQQPSGTRDPFGLRRASLAVVRLLIECKLDLDLDELLRCAADQFDASVDAAAAAPQVFDYIMDRLQGYYAEQEVSADVLDAVLARRPSQLLDLDRRVQAVNHFRALPDAASLAAANKRIQNILKKVDGVLPERVDTQMLQDKAEQELHTQMEAVSGEVGELFAQNKYEQGLTRLAALRAPVDAFFDDVLVMADDENLKNNRLALLNQLGKLCSQVADLSCLQH